MPSKMTKCIVCGKEYELCIPCEKRKNRDGLWRIKCDVPEHYKVYQILNGVTNEVYTVKEAAEKFANVDLSDVNTFKPDVKAYIDEIIAKAADEKKSDVKSSTDAPTK